MMSAYLASLLSLSIAQVPTISAVLPAGPLQPVKVDVTSRVGLVSDGVGYQVVWVDARRSLGVPGAPAANDVWAAHWPVATGFSPRNVLVARSDAAGGYLNPVVASTSGKTLTVFEGPAQGLRLAVVAAQYALPGPGLDLSRQAVPATASFAGADGGFMLAWQSPASTNSISVATVIGDGGLSPGLASGNVGSTIDTPPLLVAGNGGFVLATGWRDLGGIPFAQAQNLPISTQWTSGSNQELYALAGHPTNTVLVSAPASGVRSTPQAATAFTYSTTVYGPGYATWMGSRVVVLMEVAPDSWSTLNFDPAVSFGLVNAYPLDPGLRPVAFASALGSSAVVAEFDTGGKTLWLENVSLSATNVVSAGTGAMISQSASPQRRPTVVWSETDGAFLVLWDEAQRDSWGLVAARLSPTGQFSPRLTVAGLLASGLGAEPRAYRNSTQLGVLLGVQDGNTSAGVYPLSSNDGGVAVSPTPLIAPNFAPSFASYGDQSVMAWARSDLAIDVSFNGSAPTRLADGPTPHCVAVAQGAHWLTTVNPLGNLAAIGVNDQATMVVSSGVLINLVGTRPNSTCTTAYVAEDGSTLLASVHPTGSTGLAVTRFAPNPLRWLSTTDLGVVGVVQPFIVPITEGLLVAWVVPGTNELAGRLITPSGQVVAVMLAPPAIDRINLSVASSPEGQAALVWQEFDLAPDRGAVQVHALLVGTRATLPLPDAGMPDAGGGDAGVSDAGVSDAGVTDAGSSDSGVSDAGVADAGTDGGPELVSFVPGCGCHSFGGLAPALVWLMLLALRRRGER